LASGPGRTRPPPLLPHNDPARPPVRVLSRPPDNQPPRVLRSRFAGTSERLPNRRGRCPAQDDSQKRGCGLWTLPRATGKQAFVASRTRRSELVEGVAQTLSEAVRSFLRVGSEIGHRIRHARCVGPDVGTPTRSGGRLSDRAAAFPRRLYATASVHSRSLAMTSETARFRAKEKFGGRVSRSRGRCPRAYAETAVEQTTGRSRGSSVAAVSWCCAESAPATRDH
jgi:hypothetical protein